MLNTRAKKVNVPAVINHFFLFFLDVAFLFVSRSINRNMQRAIKELILTGNETPTSSGGEIFNRKLLNAAKRKITISMPFAIISFEFM